MAKERYVAYVGTYTHENSIGIHVYDIDVEEGKLTQRSVAPINNPSYVTLSDDNEILYSIEDEGVCAFKILPDGDLEKINSKWIGGMRGCYLDVDEKRRFLFVGGFHDGRVTMMRLRPDGGIEDIADGIFHQGLGITSNDRRIDHPKVSCVKLTPDNKYLCAADYGLNQVKVYTVDYNHGKLRLSDIIRCEMESAPRLIRFSQDARFCYILTELANAIEVYKYEDKGDEPFFERIQTIPVVEEDFRISASTCMSISHANDYIFVSVDGYNGMSWLKRDPEEGTLEYLGETMISGDFPKSIAVLPGSKYIAVLNHDSNEIRTFSFNYEEGYALMKNKPVTVDRPNCIRILKLED